MMVMVVMMMDKMVMMMIMMMVMVMMMVVWWWWWWWWWWRLWWWLWLWWWWWWRWCDDDDDNGGGDDDGEDDEMQPFRKRFYIVNLIEKDLWGMDTFSCTRMCDKAICISQHYTASLHFVFPFATPAFCLERDYFVSFEICQEIMTRSVLLLLQFGQYGTHFTTFFLLHRESRKYQFRLSPLLWRIAS